MEARPCGWLTFRPEQAIRCCGEKVPLVDDVKTTYSGLVAVGGFSVADNGTLVYRRATTAPEAEAFQQWTIERITSGKRTPLLAAPGSYYDLQLSPDGAQLALGVLGASGPDVAVYDPRRDTAPRRLSFDATSVDPAWIGKEGRYVAFLNLGPAARAVTRQGRAPGGLHWRRTDGGDAHPFLPDVRALATGSFSPTAGRLAYVAIEGERRKGQDPRPNIFTVPIAEEAGQLKVGAPERFSPQQFTEFDPQFSPDGRWIAFVADRSGREEVYVRAATASANGVRYERQISSTGGNNPRWSNRNELLYQSGDQIIAVPYKVQGDTLEPDKPTVRVEKLGSTRWDLAPDGRIAVISPVTKPADTKAPPPEHTVVFLQNFFDEVRRKVK